MRSLSPGSCHQLRSGTPVLGRGKFKIQGASSQPSWSGQGSFTENKKASRNGQLCDPGVVRGLPGGGGMGCILTHGSSMNKSIKVASALIHRCLGRPALLVGKPEKGSVTESQTRPALLTIPALVPGPGCFPAAFPGNAPSSTSSLPVSYWASSPCSGCSSAALVTWPGQPRDKGRKPQVHPGPVPQSRPLSTGKKIRHGAPTAWQCWCPSENALRSSWSLCPTCIAS